MNAGERPTGQFVRHFGAHSTQYFAGRPRYPSALFHFLAMSCAATRSAWDCATGNGQAALGLARRFATVLATDPSPEMIALAVPHKRVRYEVTKYDTRLPDHSVDLVTVAQALHWLQLDEFLRETRRILVPGGVLAAWCYGGCRVTPELDGLFDHFYSVTLGPYWSAERRHVDNGYQAIALPIDELPAPPLQIVEEWRVAQYLAYIRTWSGVAQCIAARGEEPILAFEAEVTRAWGATRGRTVRWPLHFRVGQVR